MDDQVIRFMQPQSVRTLVLRPDSFTFRPERGWVLVQRLALWALRKIGCCDSFERETLRYREVRPKNLVGAIVRQRNAIAEHFHREGSRVLVGRDEWRELMRSATPDSPIQVCGPYRHGNSPTAFNMPITVVPWMRGILVMPKD